MSTTTRPTTGQTLNLVGDTFHHQWTVTDTLSDLVVLTQDDGYTQTLTHTEYAAQVTVYAPPAYWADQDGDLWQSTHDGRLRRWQHTDHTWGPIEDTEWAKEALTLTPLA